MKCILLGHPRIKRCNIDHAIPTVQIISRGYPDLKQHVFTFVQMYGDDAIYRFKKTL